ncbi:MAG: competence protein ComEC [Actinomycetota bacterium]|nr:competence protein ComEC [Actinomycetota bacterium]
MAAASPRCALTGRVQESIPPFGTLVRVSEIRCGEQRVTGGTVSIARLDAPAGAEVDGTGWLLRLDSGSAAAALRRAGASADFHPIEIHTGHIASPAFRVAAAIRDSLRGAAAPLGMDEGALLQGIAIGDTRDFAATTLDDFRRSGLSHLLAVSGENLAMLMGAVAVVTARVARRTRLIVMAASAGLFLLVVGPQPSILRAAVMAAIALAAMAVGRSADPLIALGAAIVVVIALRPGLVFAPGLQLSAAATCGIVVWTSRIARRLSMLPRPLAIALGATTAAQIAVAPLLIALFGQLSMTGVIANLIALPAVPPATVLGLAAGTVGVFSQAVAGALIVLVRPFLAWILWVAATFGRPSWAVIVLPRWVAWPVGAAVLWWLICGLRCQQDPLPLSLEQCSPGSQRTRSARR